MIGQAPLDFSCGGDYGEGTTSFIGAMPEEYRTIPS
jgi:hypothetical protein